MQREASREARPHLPPDAKISCGEVSRKRPNKWHSQCNFRSQITSTPLWRIGVAYWHLGIARRVAIVVAIGGKADTTTWGRKRRF